MESFALDPTVLPSVPERKGTLLLKSDHMKYNRATLNSNWHADRETEPKDYDICNNKERNLLKCTYNRIGNATDGSMKDVLTTQQDSLSEVERLKSDYERREIHQRMVSEGNFRQATKERETGKPERGYGSVLPRHQLEHGTHHLITTHAIDYQYPFQWSPKEATADESSEPQFNHEKSEFTDTADHRRPGINTWQDWNGTVRDYN